ncbi:MAG TPA: glycoside hydrolase [Blastocatellia bacterium]|nr:glycoside hydrolase [Blastocatellia bacterium]
MLLRFLFASVLSVGLASVAVAQQFNSNLYQKLQWRCIGPHRGGRTVGATGVPGQPNVFYIGVNNGGIWKTNDYGRIWKPIFDEQPTGSIGALALAPSNPDVIYVGSGEGLQRPDLSTGDGVYKSTDAGKTWKHLGLRDGQQIASIIVDPRDPNRLFVAVLGHPYGANEERGVFRSTDGGESFQKVLYKDENTGAIALAFDPSNAQTVYADLWSARQGPWENGAWQGPGSGLFKSTDGGSTWRQLTKGLPTFEQGLGRIGFCVAPSDPKRMYATVDASPQLGGVYRSDDAGESWRRVSADPRPWGRGSDFAEVKVDPRNPDIVYSANIVTWRSTDGGQNFEAFRGAPGGDDYHTIWINPDNSRIILLASDQGAIVTVNGGETWSSWYNQPTAQFYHVITDNQFPYWVYGGQQESGSVGIASRGNDGQVTFREWHPVGVEEYGYVAPDPLNPNIIYGGKISRFDKTTGQVQNIAPEAVRSGKYRFLRTAPVIFSPVDPRVLYFAGNVLFKTTSGGNSWDIISPDLSREQPEVPESIGVFRTADLSKMPRRGVIYTVAPSYKELNTIWAGTDDGLIHLTRDGGRKWMNVTPPGISSWSKVSIIDAGRFDAETAYAAVNRIRLDDQRPHIYRTHDGGKTWKEIVRGLPDEPVNAVREDPVRRGLLFCGTERAVYVSFNDGDDWQPLRLNMPASSIRDLVIHNDDIVVGTHGRSFWILDDITPLREISEQVASADSFLFKPQQAYRVRWNMNTDTPLPQEEPGGKNPPDGAIINYYLKSSATGSVTLEVFDSAGKLVRRFSSADKPDPIEAIGKEVNIPTYWIRPTQMLSTEAGMQRFVWDLHYPPPEGQRPEYPIAAIYGDTPRHPLGPWVAPGNYTIKLTVGARSLSQPLNVKIDPRVKTSAEGLAQQHAIAIQCYEGGIQVRDALTQLRKLRSQLKDLTLRAGQAAVTAEIAAMDKKLGALEGAGGGRGFGGGVAGAEPSLSRLSGELQSLMELVEGADVAPTTQAIAGSVELQRRLDELLRRWSQIKSTDLKTLNEQLRKANLSVPDLK